jgi:hypothetical protein
MTVLEKRFTFGRYAASGLIEVFNLFNARNPRLIDNTFAGNAPTAVRHRPRAAARTRDPDRVEVPVLVSSHSFHAAAPAPKRPQRNGEVSIHCPSGANT